MTFLKNLWRDLVERRLWPVAAALLVALIAVPVLVGTGSKGATPAAAPGLGARAANVPQTAAQVSLAEDVSSKAKNRAGAVRNPFKPLHVVVPKTTSTATGAPAATKNPSTATSPKTPSTPSTKTPSTTGTTGTRYFEWLVKVRLGSHTAMKNHKVHGVTMLPSPDYGLVIYLGLKSDHKTALFAVSDGTAVSRGGNCQPSAAKCEVLELAKGESALLTRRAGATHFKRYRIGVLSVTMRRFTPKSGSAKSASSGRGSIPVNSGAAVSG